MVADKELDNFVKDELKKDIGQEDSIGENVNQELGGMGWLWETVNRKLQSDKICFSCKKEMEIPKDKMIVVETTGVDKGVVAFVSFCSDCAEKIHKEQQKKLKEVKKNE